jgi:hypothetical protein
MVRTMNQGLRPGPAVPRPIRRGDEVECFADGRGIHVRVLGVASDGWLLGFVATITEPAGSSLADIRIGDLVEGRLERVWAIPRREAESAP